MDDYSLPPEYMPMPSRGPVSPIVAMPTEILQMIFDPSMVIERIRHDLKGETGPYLRTVKKDDADIQETYWLTNGQRDMNDQGVESVISMLNKYVNRNTFFSQLSEDEVYKITKTIARNLAAMFAAKYAEYEIDINRMSIVKEGIVDMVFFALKQSQNAKLIDALTQLVSVSEMRDNSKKGFSISDLSPFGGNR